MENKILYFDCETTGLPPKGAKWDKDFNVFPYIVQLAWCVGDKERNLIIKPNDWEIPEEATRVHGITTEHAKKVGVPFNVAMWEFLEDALNAPLICAHNIYFDTSMIKAGVLREFGDSEDIINLLEEPLNKGKRIDTMMKTIKFVGAKYANGKPGKYPKLEELYFKLFGETFPAHDAMEDVRALKRCLPLLIEKQIIRLEEYQQTQEQPQEQIKEKQKEQQKENQSDKINKLLTQNDF